MSATMIQLLNHLSRLCRPRDQQKGEQEDVFSREGYQILVTSKQRLFFRADDEVASRVTDKRSLGSKLVIMNLSPETTEANLVPVLEQFGTLISVRLPLNPRTKLNRGHAFITFSQMEAATAAVKSISNSRLRVLLTEPSRRLFLRHIPRNRDPVEVQRKLRQMLPGLVKINMFLTAASPPRVRPDHKNVGYAFLEFQNSHYAKLAKTIISIAHLLGSDLAADWADPMHPEQHACDASGDK